ncbi:hypothetical protein FYZ48_20305 [Gimesia chilikensis]|uniref:hypothetical protein n=1 Tax=Gimesia chilikensis TaxID=2605989 RepID=UPI0011EF182E|nr:hypothetical protein [Gimesia chilikensis]KAA0134438.1 hypothetical protein FYZ48_20305 [Gimesia chilikensis]
MPIRFYVLLDNGQILPFLFDRSETVSENRITLEKPISLDIESSDGQIVCLSVDVERSRLFTTSTNLPANWVAIHELNLDGSLIRRGELKETPSAGVTACGSLGAVSNINSGIFLWHPNQPLLIPLAPQNIRGIDEIPRPGLWWPEQGILFLPNSKSDLVVYDVGAGVPHVLSLRKFEIEPYRGGDDQHLGVVSIHLHLDKLTIAWSSTSPISGPDPKFESIVRQYHALKFVELMRKGKSLKEAKQNKSDFPEVSIHEQISTVLFHPPITADDPEELFVTGFPNGQFRRYIKETPDPGNPPRPRPPIWKLADNLKLKDYLSSLDPPITTEYARFLHLIPNA